MLRNSLLPVLAAVLMLNTQGQAQNRGWDVTSPNGLVTLSVQLKTSSAPGYPKTKARLYYQVRHGGPADRVALVPESPLGLTLRHQDLLDGLRFEAVADTRRVEETYTMPHGKRRECHNVGNSLTLQFKNKAGMLLELDLRAYDDGVAFRYRLPGSGKEKLTLVSEATGFALPPEARLWMHPNDKASVYSPAYETYYENGVAAGAVSPTGMGWAFPMLFRTADARHWGLITEANVQPNFCASRLTSDAVGGVYRVRLPLAEEGNNYGDTEPSATLPWEMPWRVVIVGGGLGSIVESTLVNDLSAPSRVADTSWVRPGRVAWSWWSDQVSPSDGGKQKRFVDFAAEMGWEYVLVDANWTIMDNGTIHDVMRHAKSKNVGILLWYNTGGPNNIVTEKPRDSLFYPEVRKFELKMLRDWGVKGVKVDFFQSDKQALVDLYHGILQDAAEFKIMINYHGCTLPRGWSRTYPNLMSMEAIRGEECYIFDPKYPESAPVLNCISPFTRNVVGPMDYTPMGLNNNKYPHQTTYGHELALTVLFETAWLHFADDPDVYRKLPEAPLQFIKEVPVTWDDTRFVAGYPGQHATIARKKGNAWYVGGINGRGEKLEQTLDFKTILGPGNYQMTLIADGSDAKQFATQSKRIAGNEPVKVSLLPYGGFVMKVTPVP